MDNKKIAKENQENGIHMPFGTLNYILMGAGILLLAVGYILLSGGGSENPDEFNPAMFDNRRLVVAPVLIVLGFVVEIVAIMIKKKE